MCISHVLHTCYMSSPSESSNNINKKSSVFYRNTENRLHSDIAIVKNESSFLTKQSTIRTIISPLFLLLKLCVLSDHKITSGSFWAFHFCHESSCVMAHRVNSCHPSFRIYADSVCSSMNWMIIQLNCYSLCLCIRINNIPL